MQAMLHEAVSKLRQVHLPSLPETVIRLKEELNAKYPNTVVVANLIQKNAEMSTLFLKLANAQRNDEDEPVRDVQSAINILGLEEVYNTFVSAAFMQQIVRSADEKEVLKFSAKVAIAAAKLAPFAQDIPRSEAYLAAVAQNMGAIFLMRLDWEGYTETFFKQLAHPFSAYKEEAKLIGTTHAYAGLIVAKKWQMPAAVYESVLLHHDEAYIAKTANHPRTRQLVALTMMANYIVTTTLGEAFVTQEIRKMRELANHVIQLPDTAIKNAAQAVLKYKDIT